MLYKMLRHPPYGHMIKLRAAPRRPGILATATVSVLSPEVDESTIQLPSLLLVVGAVSLPLKCEYFSWSLLHCLTETCPLLLWSCPSLQRCCWKMMLLSLHPNIIVHVENVVSLFSSPSTSSQKVRKCGSHNFLSQAIVRVRAKSV